MSIPSVIHVCVPASSANLGPGFDVLAVALGLHLRCTLRRAGMGLQITASGRDSAEIPCDESNLIWRAFLRLTGGRPKEGLHLEIANEIPLGRGLGSSAAAIVAGLALANEWAGLGKSKDQIVEEATEMEGHPDNVAAAVQGGFVASCIAADGGVLSTHIPFRETLQAVLVVPQFQLSTEAAREVLPTGYSRADAVFNLQRLALLLEALRQGRGDLLREAMRDRLHQPYRAPLVPGFADILEMGNSGSVPGLLGVALSGAGPSVVAFCDSRAAEAGEAIVQCFRRHGVEAEARPLPIDREGLVTEKTDA